MDLTPSIMLTYISGVMITTIVNITGNPPNPNTNTPMIMIMISGVVIVTHLKGSKMFFILLFTPAKIPNNKPKKLLIKIPVMILFNVIRILNQTSSINIKPIKVFIARKGDGIEK
jgi:hypothetical protein